MRPTPRRARFAAARAGESARIGLHHTRPATQLIIELPPIPTIALALTEMHEVAVKLMHTRIGPEKLVKASRIVAGRKLLIPRRAKAGARLPARLHRPRLGLRAQPIPLLLHQAAKCVGVLPEEFRHPAA